MATASFTWTKTAAGTYTWVSPITGTVRVQCWAGGGGGGGIPSQDANAGGGGGEYAEEPALSVVAGTAYTVVVGVAGTAGPASGSGTGGNGGNTTFATTSVVAHGGTGGTPAGTSTSQGTGPGGTGSAATIHFNGGNGGTGWGTAGQDAGGGGGGSGGTAAAGNNGTAATAGTAGTGATAVTGGGPGGNGSAGVNASAPVSGPGGGGGGAGGGAAHTGGAGWAGQVIITAVMTSPAVISAADTAWAFIAPAGTSSILAELTGGGAGGFQTGTSGGAGGGGGEYAAEPALAVTAGSSYALVIGAGGASDAGGASSTIAGDSVTVTAHGGSVSASDTVGGAGGTGSTNTTHNNGGAGGRDGTTGGGGGGGSGGTAAAGNNGTAGTTTSGGAGAAAVTGGGPGGAGGNATVAGSAPVSGPGGGGGGAGYTSTTNGAGFDGQIRLTFPAPVTTSGGVNLPVMALAGTGAGGDTTTSGGVNLPVMALAGTGAETFTASGGVNLPVMALQKAPWSFAVAGTPFTPNYFIVTTAQAALITVGDIFTDTANPGIVFLVIYIGVPFAGFRNVAFNPVADVNMTVAVSDVVTQANYQVLQGIPFPQAVLQARVEILVNGTWTDITDFVQQRADITITARGRADETSSLQPTNVTLTLDNRDGRFSSKNQAGLYYPFLGRNTQLRISAQSDYIAYAWIYRFWGEVSAWPQNWDLTGTDVYVTVTASGLTRRLNQSSQVKIGSALSRYYARLTGAAAPVAYWTMEEGTAASSFANIPDAAHTMTWTGSPTLASSTAFAGSDPLPVLNSAVLDGLTSSFGSSGDDKYGTPGTWTWTAPGGVTSVTTVSATGGGGGGGGVKGNDGNAGGGGGEYAATTAYTVVPGQGYQVVVGAGGAGGKAGGDSSFDGTGLIAHGGKGGGYNTAYGAGGTGSTAPAHHNGGHGGSGSATSGTVAYPGGGGGGSGGTAAAGNNGGNASGTTAGTGATAVTGGGPGGAGGTSPGGSGAIPVSGPGGGGGGSSAPAAGANGYAGQVELVYTPSSVPPNNVVRFALSVPPAGATHSAVLLRILTAGTIARVDVAIDSGSTGLVITGYNSGGTQLFTGTMTTTINNTPMLVSAELAVNGTGVDWKLQAILPGAGSAVASVSGTRASATMGSVNEIKPNPAGTITDTVIGHIAVQYALSSLVSAAYAASGYTGELAGDRFSRLLNEAGFSQGIQGSTSDTPAMGPQSNQGLVALLQECEDVDRGLIYEPRDSFGLGYRTQTDMKSQAVRAIINYAAAQLAGTPVPTEDDQLSRNDVTVSRVNGSSYRAVLLTGAMSIQPPPNGIGEYPYGPTVNCQADTQLAAIANWILTLGTVDELRWPDIMVNLTRTEMQATFAAWVRMNIADYLQIANPPAWTQPGPIRQLSWGLAEILNAFTWQVHVNGVPESPYG